MTTIKGSQRSAQVAAVLSVFAFAGVLVINSLANTLPLNGVETWRLSDELPNLFVPAGFTFSIWALIYLLLAGYVAAAAGEAFRAGEASATPAWTAREGVLFILNAIANMAWIVSWHWRLVGTSFVVMLVVLATLGALELASRKTLAQGGPLARSAPEPSSLRLRRFLLTVPLRVYLGWICVATIANASALLVSTNWRGFGLDPRVWAVAVIAGGLGLALDYALWNRQTAVPLVIAWAYVGIVAKRLQMDPAYSASVWIAAGLSVLIILASVVLIRTWDRRRGAQTP